MAFNAIVPDEISSLGIVFNDIIMVFSAKINVRLMFRVPSSVKEGFAQFYFDQDILNVKINENGNKTSIEVGKEIFVTDGYFEFENADKLYRVNLKKND